MTNNGITNEESVIAICSFQMNYLIAKNMSIYTKVFLFLVYCDRMTCKNIHNTSNPTIMNLTSLVLLMSVQM